MIAVQLRIVSVCLDQTVVTTLLYDAPLFQYDDAIALSDGCEAMGDDKDGSSLAYGCHVVLDQSLRFVVEGAGCFVEDQYPRIADQRPGDSGNGRDRG